ncbi:MAG: guanylate kinase [Acidobacteria bacterium]|nr:guanylate kinase [Acidobacteriota bacterium]
MSNESGRLWVISAPSGAGKSSILKRVLRELEGTAFSVSHTTRDPRPGERHGVDYYFVSRSDFEKARDRGELLEWAEYNQNFYGTSEAFVTAQVSQGLDVFLDIEVVGAAQVRQRLPESKSIFVMPPSRDALEQRLVLRGTESAESLARRLSVANKEVRCALDYDFVIVNDRLDDAVDILKKIIMADRCQLDRQRQKTQHLIDDFDANG